MPVISKEEAIASGKPTEGLQTILFPKSKFTSSSARKWLKRENLRSDDVRETANYYRFMQTNPIFGAGYYTKMLPNGVELVYMKPSQK